MKTKVNKASSKHDQLRTTIPLPVREHLKLENGDTINWELDKNGGVWVAVVKKKE
jgi:bifunctional DNA-binding transcriptional regulator/antitoxin component of YhaV-PrlF toxin-antitoxin module